MVIKKVVKVHRKMDSYIDAIIRRERKIVNGFNFNGKKFHKKHPGSNLNTDLFSR